MYTRRAINYYLFVIIQLIFVRVEKYHALYICTTKINQRMGYNNDDLIVFMYICGGGGGGVRCAMYSNVNISSCVFFFLYK